MNKFEHKQALINRLWMRKVWIWTKRGAKKLC